MLAKIRFPAMTNRETWLERVEIRDEQGKPFDLSQADIRLEVRSQPGNRGPVLSAQTGDGQITGTTDGLIEWEFSESSMRNLSAGLYTIGLVYTLNNRTTQVILGDIQIDDGAVS